MTDPVEEALAEARRLRAEADELIARACAAQIAGQAAVDQAVAAQRDAIATYDDYLRVYLPDEWARRQAARPDAAQRRGERAVLDALETLLAEGAGDG